MLWVRSSYASPWRRLLGRPSRLSLILCCADDLEPRGTLARIGENLRLRHGAVGRRLGRIGGACLRRHPLDSIGELARDLGVELRRRHLFVIWSAALINLSRELHLLSRDWNLSAPRGVEVREEVLKSHPVNDAIAPRSCPAGLPLPKRTAS